MAESRDAHVVEIPVDEEHQQQNHSRPNNASLIRHHPLMEISQSPGHLLLLKLWQREEDLFGQRVALKEARLDGIKREVFQLCCFFFAFHGFHLTLLFTSSIHREEGACRKWWVPSFLSLFTSLVVVSLVHLKLFRYFKVLGQLQRERSDNRALGRCIQELRMKGASFDLTKEPQTVKRTKSSSVEIKWKPRKWCSDNVVTICLLCFTGTLEALWNQQLNNCCGKAISCWFIPQKSYWAGETRLQGGSQPEWTALPMKKNFLCQDEGKHNPCQGYYGGRRYNEDCRSVICTRQAFDEAIGCKPTKEWRELKCSFHRSTGSK